MASWIDRVTNQLTIITGDGNVYRPFWINANKSVEYNVSEFEFVNLEGTLVDRRLPKGNRYNLEIHFQGDDHLDVAKAFWDSAANPKYWVLQHPFYGNLNVQPLSLGVDNTQYNVSKFTIPIVETIVDDNPKTAVDPIDSITVTKLNLDDELENTITATITSTDIVAIKKVTKKGYDLTVPIITLPEEFEDYNNAFNQCNAFVDTATASPLLAIRSTISLLTAPARLTANVQKRVDLLEQQFNELRLTVLGLTTVSQKQVYQMLGLSIVSSMCLSVVNNAEEDFKSNKKVITVLKKIVKSYTDLLTDLDTLQSLNGGSPLSFIPTFEIILQLNDLINETITYLYNVIIFSRKERFIITDSETNVYLLTHKLYGLDNEDANLLEFVENNEFTFEELVIVPKGRKIIYYV